MSNEKTDGQNQGERKPIPIACPNIDSAAFEGLLDILIYKGVITDLELGSIFDLYGSYMNALIDLLVTKGVFKAWELDTAITNYHDFVRAMANHPEIPPQVLFGKRRTTLGDLLTLEADMREKYEKLQPVPTGSH
jgi:hypothetical protein